MAVTGRPVRIYWGAHPRVVCLFCRRLPGDCRIGACTPQASPVGGRRGYGIRVGRTTIRDSDPRDADAIAAIRVAGWRTAYAGIIEDAVLQRLDPVAEAARRRAEWAAHPTPRVAEHGGEVVGFAISCPYRQDDADPGDGEIAALYVAPGHWSLGIGSALLVDALTQLGERGHTVARLWVLQANARARRSYERNGFTADGAIACYTPRGGSRAVPEIRYRRPTRAAPGLA